MAKFCLFAFDSIVFIDLAHDGNESINHENTSDSLPAGNTFNALNDILLVGETVGAGDAEEAVRRCRGCSHLPIWVLPLRANGCSSFLRFRLVNSQGCCLNRTCSEPQWLEPGLVSLDQSNPSQWKRVIFCAQTLLITDVPWIKNLQSKGNVVFSYCGFEVQLKIINVPRKEVTE